MKDTDDVYGGNENDKEETNLGRKARSYQQRNDQILKVLNSNTENPYIIWDNATRAELLDFVEKHRNSNENNVICFVV